MYNNCRVYKKMAVGRLSNGEYMDVLNNISTILQNFINLLTGIVTLYATFLQFCSASVRVLLIKYKRKKFFGEYFILELYNTSLSSISIREVYLIFNNEKKLLIKKYDVPLLVESRRSFQVEMAPVSNCLIDPKLLVDKNWLVFIKLVNGNSICMFSTSGLKGRIKFWIKNYKFLKNLKRNPRNVIDGLDSIERYRICYGDIILRDNVRFVLIIKSGEDEQTVFITKSGSMSERCFSDEKWKRGVGVGTYQEVKERLTEAFKGEFKEEVVEFELYKVEDICSLHVSNFLGDNLDYEVLKKWSENKA